MCRFSFYSNILMIYVAESFGKPRLWVDALSQNAFDTGAGMGLMIPYSSYMTKKNGIVRYGHLIPATNNLIRYYSKQITCIQRH